MPAFCTNCGAAQTHDGAFCASCGTHLATPAPATPAPAMPAPAAPAAPAPATPAGPFVPDVVTSAGRCENCGKEVAPGETRCDECGPAPVAPAGSYDIDPGQPLPGAGRRIAEPVVPAAPTYPSYAPAPPAPPEPPAPALGHGWSPTGGPALPPPLPSGYASPSTKSGPPPWVWLVGAGVTFVLVILIAAAVNTASGQTLEGTITVYDDSASGCNLSIGYGDVHEGTRVIVTDGNDEVVATSSLGDGIALDGCEFPFTLDDLPDREEYWFEIGARDEISYTKEELEDLDWELSLTLGED